MHVACRRSKGSNENSAPQDRVTGQIDVRPYFISFFFFEIGVVFGPPPPPQCISFHRPRPPKNCHAHSRLAFLSAA